MEIFYPDNWEEIEAELNGQDAPMFVGSAYEIYLVLLALKVARKEIEMDSETDAALYGWMEISDALFRNKFPKAGQYIRLVNLAYY